MQAVTRRAALAGAAAAATAAACAEGGNVAEARAAPQVELVPVVISSAQAPGKEDIAEARKLLKGTLETRQPELLSELGNDWVDVNPEALSLSQEDLLDIGALMAQDPAVQRAALRATRKQNAELTLRLMAEQHASLSHSSVSSAAPVSVQESQASSLGFSQAEMVQAEEERGVESLASSLPESLCASVSDIVAAEDATNRLFLFRHAVKVQAAARGYCARRLHARRREAAALMRPVDGVLLSDLPTTAQVAIALTPSVRGEDGTVKVVLTLALQTTHQLPRPLPATATEKPPPEWPEEKPEVGMETISTIALIVGLLAVVVTRNPSAAPLAAASAATVITALCVKANVSAHVCAH